MRPGFVAPRPLCRFIGVQDVLVSRPMADLLATRTPIRDDDVIYYEDSSSILGRAGAQ
jgi:hypothetical protein